MTDLELAAYLDRGLSQSDRDRIETHLASCGECRAHVVASQKTLDEQKRLPRSRAMWGALAAAALLFVLLVKPQISLRDTRQGSDIRVRGETQSSRVVTYGPRGEVSAAGLRFVWGSAGAEAVYKFSATARDGSELWSISTRDTSVALPGSVTLRAGDRYFWQVDALRPDGSTLSTGLEEFVVRP